MLEILKTRMELLENEIRAMKDTVIPYLDKDDSKLNDKELAVKKYLETKFFSINDRIQNIYKNSKLVDSTDIKAVVNKLIDYADHCEEIALGEIEPDNGEDISNEFNQAMYLERSLECQLLIFLLEAEIEHAETQKSKKSDVDLTLDEFLDVITQPGSGISLTKEQLISELKEAGMLGEDNLPTKKAIDMGLMYVKNDTAICPMDEK